MSRFVRYISSGEWRDWLANGSTLTPASLESAGSSVVVVVDFPDESYVPTSIPAVRGRNRRLLERRRLEREFPGSPLRALIRLDYRGTERGDNAVMICAGGGTELAESLADLGARHALRAVYTPALLARMWIRRAGCSTRRVLITMPTPAGVRLMYLDRGQPTLSRLTGPLGSGTSAEIARTVQYLHNTERAERGVAVELWFWGIPDHEVSQYLPRSGEVRLGTSPAVAGLPDPRRHGFDALLQIAARPSPGPQFAPPGMRAGWLVRRLQRFVAASAAAVVVLAIAVAAALHWRTATMLDQAQTFRLERERLQQSIAQWESALLERGLSRLELQMLPDAAAHLQRGALDFGEALAVVGNAFGADADVEVSKLELQAGDPLTDVEGGLGSGVGRADAGAIPPPEGIGAIDAGCLGESAPQAAMQVDFGLRAGIGLRRREAALSFVGEAATQQRGWRTDAALRRLATLETLTVTGRADGSADTARWRVCLRQGAGA